VHGFLLHRLAGRPVTDFSEAAEMLLLDRSTAVWSDELCALAGIRREQLADLLPAGAVAGPLTNAVAQTTGLPPDVLVIVGGHDQCCAALGLGVTAPGQLMLASGTAWVLTALTPDLAPAQIPDGMELNYHITPGLHTLSQLLGGFGAVTEWWLKLLWPDAENRYAELEAAFAASPSGARDLHFLAIGGSAQLGTGRGGFLGLRLDHTRHDMVRALCEGIAYEVRWALDALAGTHLPAQRIWMTGGATQSPCWAHLIADVTGVPVQVAPHANWTARGAAILAGAGVGLLAGDLVAAAQNWQCALAEITPDPLQQPLYAAAYADYRRMCTRLTDEE
jgi:xylulokinase